jgi:hypothetical protein
MWSNFIFINVYFLIINKIKLINEGVISPFKNLDVDSLEELLVDLEVVKGKNACAIGSVHKG